MAFKFVYPDKDNTIGNITYYERATTASNLGYNELLYVYKAFDANSNIGVVRSLLSFSYDGFNSWFSSSNVSFVTSSVTYCLKLTHNPNLEPNKELAESFDLTIYPLTRFWDEGTGMSWSDLGYSNWKYATSTTEWTLTGSDYYNLVSASQHFDSGIENLYVDVTDIVEYQRENNNYGFVVKLSEDCETNSNEYETKSFWSRHTHYLDYRPRLELWYDDHLDDCRGCYEFNTTGSLYVYNISKGQFANFVGTTSASALTASLYNNSDISSATFSSSFALEWLQDGVYKYQVSLPLTSSLTDLADEYSGKITLYEYIFDENGGELKSNNTVFAYENPPYLQVDPLRVIIQTNIKNVYKQGERAKIEIFMREKWPQKGTVRSLQKERYSDIIYPSGSYRLEYANTSEVLVPFGEYSLLSSDQISNYFWLDTNSLAQGFSYKLRFRFYYGKEIFEPDDYWTFKVI